MSEEENAAGEANDAERVNDTAEELSEAASARAEQRTAALDAFAHRGTADSLDEILDLLDESPVDEHAEIFDRLHGELRRLLDQDPSALPKGLVDSIARPTSAGGDDPETTDGTE
ncbi:hypothetical protein ACIGDM_11510 [Rothia koreensis]|jgi:hypothetical protein|uniref:hypothetical protein n=1 Tax=Rothia koreensis TaxID=592378 RepID=UPI0037C5B21A